MDLLASSVLDFLWWQMKPFSPLRINMGRLMSFNVSRSSSPGGRRKTAEEMKKPAVLEGRDLKKKKDLKGNSELRYLRSH